MEGTVTISIEDFDRLRHCKQMLGEVINKIKACSEVAYHGTGIDQRTFLKVDSKKTEELLKDYNPENGIEGEWIDYVAWNKQVSVFYEDTAEEIEKSLLVGYRHEQLAKVMETLERLDDLEYVEKALEHLTGKKVKCIDDFLYELEEELANITTE